MSIAGSGDIQVSEKGKRPLSSIVHGMRLQSLLLLMSVLIVVAGIAYSLFSAGSHVTPQQRISQIESEVKCPSCDGISALDSNTAGAFAVRSFVEQAVNAGESTTQILNSLEGSYGPTILMSPPSGYGGRIIATLPFVFVAVILGLVGFFGYRRKRKYRGIDGGMQDRLFYNESPGSGPGLEPLALADKAPGQVISVEDEMLPSGAEAAADTALRGRRRLGSIRQSWVLYLGAVLLLGGIGSGIWMVRSQDHAQKQLAKAVILAQNEAQTILKARVLANQGQDVQALQLLSSVLEVDPNQPVALTYQGWLLRQAGEKDKSALLINQGQQFLEKAVKLDPSYPDARVFLGYILFQDRHDVAGAITQFAAFLADKPSASFVSATKSVIISAYQQAGLPVPSQLS